jgi:hypothetical protein
MPIGEDTHNNQPKIEGRGGGNTGEEVQPGGIAWGMLCQCFGGDNDQ